MRPFHTQLTLEQHRGQGQRPLRSQNSSRSWRFPKAFTVSLRPPQTQAASDQSQRPHPPRPGGRKAVSICSWESADAHPVASVSWLLIAKARADVGPRRPNPWCAGPARASRAGPWLPASDRGGPGRTAVSGSVPSLVAFSGDREGLVPVLLEAVGGVYRRRPPATGLSSWRLLGRVSAPAPALRVFRFFTGLRRWSA